MSEHQPSKATSKTPSHLKLVWPPREQCPSPAPKVHGYLLGFALFGLSWHVTAESFAEQERLLVENSSKSERRSVMASFGTWLQRWRTQLRHRSRNGSL